MIPLSAEDVLFRDAVGLFRDAVGLIAEGHFDRALEQFEVAGVKGHGGAALMAGILSLSGFGTSSSKEANHASDALFWFGRAAALGETEGEYKYAEMLTEGHGTDVNKTEARSWIRAAAHKEHPKALCYLAHEAYNRRDTPGPDLALLSKAAKQGHDEAQFVISVTSSGFAPHVEKWATRSADQGYEPAVDFLMSQVPQQWREFARGHSIKAPRMGFPNIAFADVSAQADLEKTVVYLSDYEPYRDGSNPRFNGVSQRLLNLKRGDPDAIDYYAALLNRKMQEMATCIEGVDLYPSVLVTMPSHQQDASEDESPIDQVCALVADSNWHMQDGRHCLYRTETVERQAGGKRRSLKNHYESLGLRDVDMLRSQVVILLDDVVTTGRSMRAAYYRLKQAKVREVLCVALAGTVRS